MVLGGKGAADAGVAEPIQGNNSIFMTFLRADSLVSEK
jgi:hypothetical protein